MNKWIALLISGVWIAAAPLSASIMTTAEADIRIFSTKGSDPQPSLTKVDHAVVNITFNTDLGTIAGSIDLGVMGRINIESASLPDGGDTEDPFTVDAFYQELGGSGNLAPLHPNAKVVLLFVDPKTIVGSFTAGKKQEFTGSFVIKLK